MPQYNFHDKANFKDFINPEGINLKMAHSIVEKGFIMKNKKNKILFIFLG